jgi:hypothetical protein
MHRKTIHRPMLLVAGAIVAALAAAPTAAASPQTCTDSGAAVQCGSPGNSQITASPPYVQQQQQLFIIIRRDHR